jgi:hypothetical protein
MRSAFTFTLVPRTTTKSFEVAPHQFCSLLCVHSERYHMRHSLRVKMFGLLCIFLLTGPSGCNTSFPVADPAHPADTPVAYGYYPLDPLPVLVNSSGSAKPTASDKLACLPDETVRIAIGELDAHGGITFGVAKTGIAGNSYKIVLDYIKFDTRHFGVKLEQPRDATGHVSATVVPDSARADADHVVPVYVGVGVRLTAEFRVMSSTVDLGNLFAVGAAAEAKRATQRRELRGLV